MAKGSTSSRKSTKGAALNKTRIIPCAMYKVDPSKFITDDSPIKKNSKSDTVAFIRHMNKKLGTDTQVIFQTPKLKITYYGVPDLHEQYAPSDDKREYMKIPVDPSQDTYDVVSKFLMAIDQEYSSDKMKKKLFGKRWEQYEYIPCFRESQAGGIGDSEDSENSKPKKSDQEKPNFFKVKFDISSTDTGRKNMTEMYKMDGDERIPMKLDTMTEIFEEIPFLSEIIAVIKITRVWAMHTVKKKSETKTYGIGFKFVKIKYFPATRGYDEIGFLSDEDDSDFDVNAIDDNKDDSDSEKSNSKSESESSDDSEPKSSKSSKSSKSNKSDKSIKNKSESESEQSEDIPKKSKKSDKEPEPEQKSESESEHDSESSEDAPKKKSKKKGKKKTNAKKAKKIKIEDSSEASDSADESEEEIAAKTKKSKKSKKSKN